MTRDDELVYQADYISAQTKVAEFPELASMAMQWAALI
jgi:hypothetical protein